MSNSTGPRITRKSRPKLKLRRHTYRTRALEPLLEDFARRCAYSMQHEQRAGGLSAMEVDHFDPRKKREPVQVYDNLFLSTRHCNLKKRDFWPSSAERKLGVRFLDCCQEEDYGVHLFEDPVTHEVFGVTPAGRYHSRMCDLNAPHFVEERRRRSELKDILSRSAARVKRGTSFAAVRNLIVALQGQVEMMIPEIALQERPPRLGI